MGPEMVAYRQPDIITQRPYGFAIDDQGWLWEGQSSNILYGHNIHTAECKKVPLGVTRGSGACDIKFFGGMLIIAVQNGQDYVVHDLSTGKTHARPLPGQDPIFWYMEALPDGRLVLFERHHNKLLLLDEPLGELTVIDCPFEGNIAAGRIYPDGLLYMSVINPSRLIRFDPSTNRFVDEIPCPRTDASLTGGIVHDGILYSADSPRGQFHPCEIAKGIWHDPIPVPGYDEVFGFIGGCASYQGKGYFSLSSYRYPSRLNPETGKIITVDPASGETVSPEIAAIGCDGKPHRFLGKQLIFDPATQAFDFLEAPPQPDGNNLICYNLATEHGLYVTGYVIPHGEPGEDSKRAGEWLILQSHEAADEPGYDSYDFNFDKKAHIDATRNLGAVSASLYIPETTNTPPIENLQGSIATHHPVGIQQRILRRAAKTDQKAFLQGILDRILLPQFNEREITEAVLTFVNQATYYSPVQELAAGLRDPVALLACHNIRCGSAANLMKSLIELAGVECRIAPMHHHVIAEAHFDGAWRACDALFFGSHFPVRDGHWLSLEELWADPYFADTISQACFVFADDCVRSRDGYYTLGYNFGTWGWEPYYSYYVGADFDTPPTLPTLLPAQRLQGKDIELRWVESIKRGGGAIEYGVGIYADRQRRELVHGTFTKENALTWEVPDQNRMYFVAVQALDDHREKNPDTWYPTTTSNFVLVPPDQYGWYGIY